MNRIILFLAFCFSSLAAYPPILRNYWTTNNPAWDGSYLTNANPAGATNLNQFVTLKQLQESTPSGLVMYFNTLTPASGFTLTGTTLATNWAAVNVPAQNTNAIVTTANGEYVAAFISTNTFKTITSGLVHTEVFCFDNVAGSGDISAEVYLINSITMAEEIEFTPAPAYQTVPAGSTPTKLIFSTPVPDYTSTTNLRMMIKFKVSESSTPNPTIRIVTGGSYPSHASYTVPISQAIPPVITTLYTNVGAFSHVWTYTNGTAQITMMGGGGSGGSGRSGAGGANRFGGGGAASGAWLDISVDLASNIGSGLLFTNVTGGVVGAGATGAASATDADGNNGSSGGISYFGGLKCYGGDLATGGTATAGTAGLIAGKGGASGGNGGSGVGSTGLRSQHHQAFMFVASGGGGGGGLNTGTPGTEAAGGAGGPPYEVSLTGATGGLVNGGNGSNGYDWPLFKVFGGGGGAGGGSNDDGPGGTGGNGGWPGGGGGGGGACISGQASGAGGNGAGGYVRIIERQ